MIVSVPYEYYRKPLADLAARDEWARPVRIVSWAVWDEPSDGVAPADIDLVVLPFHTTSANPSAEYVTVETLRRRLGRASGARVVQAASIGVEGLAECVPPQATLCNARGVMEPPTAELAVTLLLAHMRDLPGFIRHHTEWDNRRTPGLMGSRVMLLGFGGVGQAVAQRLVPFGVELVRVARSSRTTDAGEWVHAVSEVGDLLPSVDAVVCSLPLLEGTRGLVDESFFARMAEGAVFVNVGRGAVVNTDALLSAARAGKIRAALDVVDPEPLPGGHPLWDAPNVVITPHVGGNTRAAVSLQVSLLAQQVRQLAQGSPPLNVVGGGPMASH